MTENDKTKLPPALLASLYRHSLVEGRPSEPAKDVAPPPLKEGPDAGPPALGGFAGSVLVLVGYEGTEAIPGADLELLMKILKACRLGMDDVLVANVHGLDPEGRRSLIEGRRASSLLLFGMGPAEVGLPMDFPAMKVQRHGQARYLHAPALPALQKDDGGKRVLWGALKQMFDIP